MPKHKRKSSSSSVDYTPPPRSKTKMADQQSVKEKVKEKAHESSMDNVLDNVLENEMLNGKFIGLEHLEVSLGEVSEQVAENKNNCMDSSRKIDLLISLVVKQQKQIDSLNKEVEELKSRSMRDNIIIHNVPENDSVSIHEVTIKALKDAGYSEVDDIIFDRIHRGPGIPSKSKPRIIIAKPHYYKDVERLIRVKSKAEKEQGAWVSPQHTEAVREVRRQMGEQAEMIRKSQPKANIKFGHTTLVVNGSIIKPPLVTPSVDSILKTTAQDHKDLAKINFTSKEHFHEDGSSFTARICRVKALNEVRAAYRKLLLNPDNLEATHNIAGFYLPDNTSGYADDGDYGLGRSIVRALTNNDCGKGYAVFVSRKCSGKKLGMRRFDIVKELTQKLISSEHKLPNLNTDDIS